MKHPLRRWRESHEKTVTLAELSAQLGASGCPVGKPQLSEIERWKKLPSLVLACALEGITKIPPRDFLRPAETQEEPANGL